MTEVPSLAKQRRLNVIEDLRPNDWDKAVVERVQQEKLGAERFILGDEASFALGRWTSACEDILLDNVQFAKTPFPKTYVELTLWMMHRGMQRPVSGPDETADDRFGFLVNGNHVRTIVTSPGMKGARLGVFEYWIDTPDPERLMQGPREREDHWRAALLMGSSHHALIDSRSYDHIVYGTRIRTTVPTSYWYPEERVRDPRYGLVTRMQHLMIGAAGEMRTLWATLALINQHRHRIETRSVPRQALITPRGRKVYMAHTLISIPISGTPQEIRKTFYPNTRHSPVGHEVRAHWRDIHIRKGCIHEWPLVPDDDGRFNCARCNGYRRRIASHHRGRSDVGYNEHTYEVTP